MPLTTVSLAKTTRPTLSMVLNRERLFEKLDVGMDKKTFWIFGPPGSGKTTLMASYIEARDRLSLWYQLDGNDADVASFFFYLRQSAIKHSKESKHQIPELPANVADWSNYGRQLFRAIFSRLHEPLIIVFDNYESVPPHSDIHEIFRQVINEVPNGSLLVFISRTSPAPYLARSLANDQLGVINADDLRLNDEECANIAKLRKADVSSGALEKILQSSDGWVTGSIIMLEYTKQSRTLDIWKFGKTGNILFDYVASEIFESFDEAAKKILLNICWSRRLNTDLAESISGDDSTRQLLANLARNNYFVTERDDSLEREYIIHPILREFLQGKARELFNENTISKIQRRTAELLIKEGQTEEAVELLAGNLDWDTLEPVIIQHAPLLIQQGRPALLASWLEELPHDRLNRNPWLLLWYGMARRKQAPREARHYFELAFREFRNDKERGREGMILCCCGVIESVLAEMDDFSLLDNWINELTELIHEDTGINDLPEDKSVIVLILTALMIRKPDHASIDAWFTRAEESLRSELYGVDRSKDLIWLSLVYLLSGDLVKASEKLELLRHLKYKDDPEKKCQSHLLFGLYHVLCGDGDNAYGAVLESLALAEEYTLNNLLPLVYACGCCAALTQNNLDESDVWIGRLASAARSNRRSTWFLYHYILSWRALASDEIINSHHEQRRALGYAIELGMPYFEVLSRTALGQLLYICGDTRGVNAQLRRVHSIARDIKNPLLEYMTLLVYGNIAMSQGRISTGTNALRYALGLGRKHAYYHLPWWQPEQLSNICAIALQHKIETGYVRDFINRRSLQPVSTSIDIPDWPWPYRISIFGELAIDMHEGTEAETAKSKGRPLQLLKVLIAMGGRDVDANAISETLWPHVDRDYGIKSLTINLHRLRRMFGNDDTVLLRDGCLSVNASLVWLDIWALEHHVAKIESTITMTGKVQDESGLSTLFDRLIEIYRGPFLNDSEEYACFISARNHYRIEFIKGINILVDTMITCGFSGKVPELYNQSIQKDPFAEAIYRRLILWYLDTNRHADAMDTFERCRIAMARTPQQLPSAETQSIYNQLVNLAG